VEQKPITPLVLITAKKIDKHEETDCHEKSPEGQCIVPAFTEYDFTFKEYDETYETELTSASHKANEMINLQIEATDLPETKKFAVKQCTFVDKIADESDPSVFTYERYLMFDASTGCTNDYIDLSVAFREGSIQIQHRLFLLTKGDHDSYVLECDIKVCDIDDTSSECTACQEPPAGPTPELHVEPGMVLSFNGNWDGEPSSTDIAVGLSYNPSTGSFSPAEDIPTEYTLGDIELDMVIEKSHYCSDHIVILRNAAGKAYFTWSGHGEQVTAMWNCDGPYLCCGTTCQSVSGHSEIKDYDWDLQMDSSGVRMYIDGAHVASCSSLPSWYGSPFTIWIGSDNDEEGSYGNYRDIQISNVITARTSRLASDFSESAKKVKTPNTP